MRQSVSGLGWPMLARPVIAPRSKLTDFAGFGGADLIRR
jgi:hypothetical protein